MYSKIIVPLDGSKLAESVLPHVEQIAKGCATEEVILVSVTELVKGTTTVEPEYQSLAVAPASTIQQTDYTQARGEVAIPPQPAVPVTVGKMWRQAWRYLERIARRLDKKGITVGMAVGLGDPAEQITKFADEYNSDLIVMASHGRSGISRWAHGSVADRVFRASNVPVLMIKAPGAVPRK